MSKASRTPDPSALKQVLDQVLKCYTARSPHELRTIHSKTYTATASFIDPFVKADGQQEAMLQFYSLQKLFSTINVTLKTEPEFLPGPSSGSGSGSGSGGGSSDKKTHIVSVDCLIDYEWREGGVLSRLLGSNTTPVECTVSIEVEDDTNQVVVHTDLWNSPSVPNLPMAIRKFNCAFTNTIFRVLGWEKELENSNDDNVKTK